MELTLTLMAVIFGVFAVTHVHGTQKRDDVYANGVLCKLSATKRMLKSIGIGSSTKCLLNNKRDIANLVSTYLNMGEKEDKRDEKEILFRELEDLFDHTLEQKRAGYCCSPACDPFMANLGNPSAATITCE